MAPNTGKALKPGCRKRATDLMKGPSLLTLFPGYRTPRFRVEATKKSAECVGELRTAYLHRGLVLYVGAGVSRSLGLPSWPELIRSLSVGMMSRKVSSAIGALKKLSEEQRLERLSKLNEEVEKGTEADKPILMMARAVKDDLGEELALAIARNLYRPVARRLFYKWQPERRFSISRSGAPVRISPGPLPTSPLVDAIVDLARSERDVRGVQAIVNYNYDDLLDERLREQHVRCKTVLSGRERVSSGTLPCYHVHGVISSRKYVLERSSLKAEGNFVFSEDEYHAEYSDPYRWSNMTQISLLGRHIGLFVGLSMEDPNIRRLIDVTHRQYPDNRNYAILTRKRSLHRSADNNAAVLRNLFEEVESKSFDRIGVKVIWVDEHAEIASILERVCCDDGAG
jgi:hypothetical protein